MTFIKGHKTWLGKKHSPESKAKMSRVHKGKIVTEQSKRKQSLTRKRLGIKPPSRKGQRWNVLKEVLTYSGIHAFIKRTFGSPKKCSNCGLEGKKNKARWNIHWANVSGEYLRDRSDWLALCVSCHKKYDLRKRK